MAQPFYENLQDQLDIDRAVSELNPLGLEQGSAIFCRNQLKIWGLVRAGPLIGGVLTLGWCKHNCNFGP